MNKPHLGCFFVKMVYNLRNMNKNYSKNWSIKFFVKCLSLLSLCIILINYVLNTRTVFLIYMFVFSLWTINYVSGKRKCTENSPEILKVLSDLMGHENQEVRKLLSFPHVHSFLYNTIQTYTFISFKSYLHAINQWNAIGKGLIDLISLCFRILFLINVRFQRRKHE